MPKCTPGELDFWIEANFEGGVRSAEGGRPIGLSAAVAYGLHDPHDPDRITHALRDLITAQRRRSPTLSRQTLASRPDIVALNRVLMEQFITAHPTPAAALYDQRYCQRGEAENQIKETQLDLFGTRLSCHTCLANWPRQAGQTLI